MGSLEITKSHKIEENLKTYKETRLSYFESLKNYYQKTAELEQAVWNVPTFEGGKKK